MDIEGFVRKRIDDYTYEDLTALLASRIREYKDLSEENSCKMAEAVIDEVKTTLELNSLDDDFLKEIVDIPKADVAMGKMGVGSRGAGDFFVHRKIAEIVSSTNTASLVNPSEQDDGGVVKAPVKNDDVYVTTAVDGIHSRLSDYPFLGGFHVTRATLRDVCVMGADPVAILSDVHLADDGDVGKIFDFTAGVAAVSELVDVPIVAGSTLRVGGDMVLGDRFVSAVGSVGVSDYPPTARKGATEGDVILLTEGSGGGTITTTALYNGFFDVIWDTLNVNFVQASHALFEADLIKDIHAMTDVTNGGLRGDAHEISNTTGVGLEFYEKEIRDCVAPKVLNMLETLNIDPLGVSTDSLMLIAPPEIVGDIKKAVAKYDVPIREIGKVDNSGEPNLIKEDGNVEKLVPLFREAAYTKVKKFVGDTTPEDFEIMKEKVQKACDESILKKDEKGYFYIIDAFLAVLILLIVILMVNSIVSMSNPNYSSDSHNFKSAQDTMELLSSGINSTDRVFIEDISSILDENHNSKYSVRKVSKLCREKFKKLGLKNYQFKENNVLGGKVLASSGALGEDVSVASRNYGDYSLSLIHI